MTQRTCPERSRRVALRQGGTLYYLHADHLGSASLATTAGGAEVLGSRTGYYPYGGVRYGGTGLPTDRTFTGQQALPSAGGLMYYGARFYDSALGRFISADTIVPQPGNPQAWNRYAYVYNNPLKFKDPSGHAPPGPLIDGECTSTSCRRSSPRPPRSTSTPPTRRSAAPSTAPTVH